MCHDGWDNYPTAYELNDCPDCGEWVDEHGDAIEGCNWSPCICETCGNAPCDGSC